MYIHFRVFCTVLLRFCTFIIFLFLHLTTSCKGQYFTESALSIIIWLCLPYSILICLDAGVVNWAAWIAGHSVWQKQKMWFWVFVWMGIYFIKSGDKNIINDLLYHKSNWFCANRDYIQKCWHPGEEWFSWEAFATWLNQLSKSLMPRFQKWEGLGLLQNSVTLFHLKLRLLKDSSCLKVSKPGFDTIFQPV